MSEYQILKVFRKYKELRNKGWSEEKVLNYISLVFPEVMGRNYQMKLLKVNGF